MGAEERASTAVIALGGTFEPADASQERVPEFVVLRDPRVWRRGHLSLYNPYHPVAAIAAGCATFALATIVSLAIKVAAPWDRAVVLRLGQFRALRGPGVFQSAISWASQTALRDIIGKTMLADMLEGRDKISTQLQKIIDQRTEPWGVNVISIGSSAPRLRTTSHSAHAFPESSKRPSIAP